MCKPDGSGCDNLQACAAAFRDDWNGGYQFMSVLTHDLGRGGSMGQVPTLPTNVCGFDSETWKGGKTPWDMVGVDWPTTEVNVRDPLKIVWDISYGPHFSDTQEFVNYITKDSFVYDKDRPLTWDDFEPEPFCVLRHSPENPGANQQIIPRVSDSEFDTWCTLPTSKTGRHIIYSEWGRNHYTFERFHGCMDVVVVGGDGSIASIPTRSPTTRPPTTRAPVPAPSPENPPQDQSLVSSEGIMYPCCGWNGDCQEEDNTWCHSDCGRCTGPCNGVYYSAPGAGTVMCGIGGEDVTDTGASSTKNGCCTWGGWSTCPDWTRPGYDPVRTSVLCRVETKEFDCELIVSDCRF